MESFKKIKITRYGNSSLLPLNITLIRMADTTSLLRTQLPKKDAKMTETCKSCHDPLTLTLDPEDSGDEGQAQASERQPYDVVRQALKDVELDSSRRVELEDYVGVCLVPGCPESS